MSVDAMMMEGCRQDGLARNLCGKIKSLTCFAVDIC